VSVSAFDEQVGGEHYLDWPIQLMVFFIKNKIPKAEGDVIQYILRKKGSRNENLDKAIHVLQMLKEIENE
jgi:hypothetical protein